MKSLKFLLLFLLALPAFAQTSYLGTCFTGLPTCGPFLNSLAVTPVNPTLVVGQTRQMLAEGVENDTTDGGAYGPQCDTKWTSSNTGVATVGTQGLVTAVGAGTTTVKCQLTNSINGSSLITVVSSPQITTPSCTTPPCALPPGTNGVAYSFTFVGFPAGGTWSVTAGSLPGWGSLGAGTGILSGTAATGSSSFTVTYTNGGTASLAVTLAVSGTTCGPPNYACAQTNFNTVTWPATAPNVGGLSGAGNTYTDPIFGTTGVRVTDANTDPAMIGTNNDTYSFSNGGSDDDNVFSTDDTLLWVGNGGGNNELIAMNPTTLAISRPYSTVTSGCPRGNGNCSTYGGFSGGGSWEFSSANPCILYVMPGSSASLLSYTFGHDVSASNSCSGSISGPPVPATVENFVQSNGNCLPTNFGSPTWVSDGGTVVGDAIEGFAFSSANYHNGSSTGQGSGFYIAIWSPTKGCMTWNTSTGAIVSDQGWVGGSGLTCTGSGCSGTVTDSSRFTIHNFKCDVAGVVCYVQHTTCLTPTCVASVPYAWVIGTTQVYKSQSTKTTGHWTPGQKGLVNEPGSPIWADWYRTEGVAGEGTPVQLTALPSPNQAFQLDSHMSYVMANSNDTNPFAWASSTAQLGTSGGGYLPFDQPTGPWWNEIDLTATNSSGNQGCAVAGANCATFREGLTFNSGQESLFNSSQDIIGCSQDGKFCGFGSSWYCLRNAGGTSTTTQIPQGPVWLAGKTYPLNYIITPNTKTFNAANNSFKVTTAGSAAPTEPNWGTTCNTAGQTCTDSNGVVYTNLGKGTGVNQCGSDAFVLKLQ